MDCVDKRWNAIDYHDYDAFPYSNVPCLTAIGSSGVKVWNNDGFIEAVDLTSSLNMAWLELNILETTASILGENSDDEAVENGVVEAEKEDGEEEPEESKVGDELNLVFTTRFTQFFKWMEKPLPASSSFFERASNAFDASRRLIINKAAGQVVISQNVKNKKGAAARFAAIASLACLCTIPALFGYYKWIVASLKKEEKEELREVLKALDEKVSANTKDICVLQLEASKMREWKSEMEAFSSATTSDIRVLQLAVSKMSEWRSAMEASSSLLRRNTENSRIARQELDMAMHTLKFNKMMRGL
ncbi:hypothetical protein IGI04_017032 [Brassica rapa subsp. trilocularis]|uniref:Uncharacterized protein n=1 Tax=Brassica rapa subsp. trilocularis TaxID=1813537 RepID=A0ABQ7MUX8_BRACM|nr:hypothetical protein IGI04_017032 [Brassica rapa subsp. trilocularis]